MPINNIYIVYKLISNVIYLTYVTYYVNINITNYFYVGKPPLVIENDFKRVCA